MAQLAGAQEQLLGLYDAERAGRAGGRGGLDADHAPATPKSLNKALAEALAKRDAQTRLQELEAREQDDEKREPAPEQLLTKHAQAGRFPSLADRLAPAARN